MKRIRNKLSIAACTLLSQNTLAAEAIDNAWELDSTLLHYSEDNDRVAVTKAVLSVKGIITSDDSAILKVVFDSMAGATPSGAVRQSSLTFTGASGGGISATGQSAALAQFDDTRTAMSLDWKHQFSRTFDLNYSGAVSIENDYRSFSAATTANKETESKAYKFTLGIASTLDQIFRVGGNDTPVPLSRVENNLSFGNGDRNTVDVIAGVTYVINRRTVGQLNFAYGLSNGYHTDVYKVFSITDALGNEQDQFYESRPDSRARNSITFNLNHQLYPSNNIFHASYRYYTDDWEIDSHTLGFSYRYKMTGAHFLEPNIRYYTQTNAYFYQNSLFKDPTDPTPTALILPEFISADYRLDEMNSITAGLVYGKTTTAEGGFRARLEYIAQSFKNTEFDENNAIVAQVSYSKRF